MKTEEKRITLRVPIVLAGKVDRDVKRRRGEERKFSLNDWIVEAMRRKLDPGTGMENAPHTVREMEGLAQRTSRAAELAAKIPGLQAGVGGHPASGQPAKMENLSIPATSSRPWLPELVRLSRMGEVDPGSSAQEFDDLIGGRGFKPPKGWALWSTEKRARWLDENKPLESR
jgi:hypothetical protein